MSNSQPYWESELESQQDAIKDINAEQLDALLEEESSNSKNAVLGGLAALTGLGAGAAAVKKIGENPDTSRRSMLAAIGTAGAAGVAGCADRTNQDTAAETEPSSNVTDTPKSTESTATAEPTASPTPSRKDTLMDEMRLPQGYEENFDDIQENFDNRFAREDPRETIFKVLDTMVNHPRNDTYPSQETVEDKVSLISRAPFAYSTDHEHATMTLEALLQNAHLFDEEFPKHTVGENLIVDNGVFVSGETAKTADVVYEDGDGELDLGINLPALGLKEMWLGKPSNTGYASTENVPEFGYQFRDATAAYMNGIGIEPSDNMFGAVRDLGITTTPASMNDEIVAIPTVPLYESDTEGYRNDPEKVISNVMNMREVLKDTDADYGVLGETNGEIELVETGEDAVYEQIPESIGIAD